MTKLDQFMNCYQESDWECLYRERILAYAIEAFDDFADAMAGSYPANIDKRLVSFEVTGINEGIVPGEWNIWGCATLEGLGATSRTQEQWMLISSLATGNWRFMDPRPVVQVGATEAMPCSARRAGEDRAEQPSPKVKR